MWVHRSFLIARQKKLKSVNRNQRYFKTKAVILSGTHCIIGLVNTRGNIHPVQIPEIRQLAEN